MLWNLQVLHLVPRSLPWRGRLCLLRALFTARLSDRPNRNPRLLCRLPAFLQIRSVQRIGLCHRLWPHRTQRLRPRKYCHQQPGEGLQRRTRREPLQLSLRRHRELRRSPFLPLVVAVAHSRAQTTSRTHTTLLPLSVRGRLLQMIELADYVEETGLECVWLENVFSLFLFLLISLKTSGEERCRRGTARDCKVVGFHEILQVGRQ